MKKLIPSFCVIVLMSFGLSSYSQQMKMPADSTTKNTELSRLKMDISSLSMQLTAAQIKLSDFKSGLNRTGVTTETKQPYETASLPENHALNTLHNQIFLLSDEIGKKQQRLREINPVNIL